jgi:glycosyltransferase involved in cell wall biosynthesis
VEGTNGLLFKAEDVSDLALSCSKLLDNPEYRSELGLRGRDWVIENRDWSVLITKYVDAYELLKKEHFS